eukprot:3039516-Karenia_brevis.AAC.1
MLGAKPGWCTTTVLSVLSPGSDPAVTLPASIVENYISTWLREKHLRGSMARLWSNQVLRFQASGQRKWNKISFPIEA